MKVNMKTSAAGPDGSYGPGVCDVPDAFARDLIAGGYATPAEAETAADEFTEAVEPDDAERADDDEDDDDETADDEPEEIEHADAPRRPPTPPGRRGGTVKRKKTGRR